jgi:hypothetical protein
LDISNTRCINALKSFVVGSSCKQCQIRSNSTLGISGWVLHLLVQSL